MQHGPGRLAVALIAELSLAALAGTGASTAGTYYVATDGKRENDGSEAKPCPSMAYAFSEIGGGRAIVVKPGFYRGPVIIPRSTGGVKKRPTIIRPEVKWKTVMIGDESHCMSSGSDCGYVVVDGFEVHGPTENLIPRRRLQMAGGMD